MSLSWRFTRRMRNSTRSDPHTDDSGDSGTPPDEPFVDDPRDETISSSAYAQRCKELMQLYDDLQSLNVESDFEDIIPRVVVIGSQSSGKSSLVEAVTGITVPRDSGTCTRCPMECRMFSNASTWSCEVFIRSKRGHIQPFGGRIVHKSQVELALRRAQAAVLCPHRDSSDFLTMSESAVRSLMTTDPDVLSFSKDAVVIKVRDPLATDLSFVDLPGLIQNALDEKLISTVKTLVESYIRGKRNTLIVIAMPATDDYENLGAVTLARHRLADPQGVRTIGVLTKPDMLGDNSHGAQKNWKEVLEGTRHGTHHGYFCVRLPDDAQRETRISREELQRTADRFFSTTSPWSEIDDRSRFGIRNFVQYVSQLLIELIEKSLPTLRLKVEEKLRECRSHLADVPPLFEGHASTEVILRVTKFCQSINDAIAGERYKDFVQTNLETYHSFKNDIIATTPELRPFEGGSLESRRCNGCSKLIAGSQTEARGLDVVRNRIKTSLTWELPGHIPFEVTKNLLRDYIDLWDLPVDKCFKSADTNFVKLLDNLLDEHFGPYYVFRNYVSELTLANQNECVGDCKTILNKILRMEKNPLNTQNSEVLLGKRVEWKTSLHNENGGHGRHGLNKHPCCAPTRVIIHNFKPETVKPRGRPITWTVEDEIDVMAGVQGYFHVAHQRIMDYVPLAIEQELNQNLAENISQILIDQVMQDTAAQRITFDHLLSEDPVMAARRKELLDRLSRLEKIQGILDQFKHLELPDAEYEDIRLRASSSQLSTSISAPTPDSGSAFSLQGQ